MRLMKLYDQTYKRKRYYQWRITIPPKQIKELNWKQGQELQSTIKNGKLILTAKLS